MADKLYICRSEGLEEEDVIRLDHKGQTFCIYHRLDGFFATDGYCTHEEEHLEDGIVIGNVIECPLHQGVSMCAPEKPCQPRHALT